MRAPYWLLLVVVLAAVLAGDAAALAAQDGTLTIGVHEIGRASCRERV